MTLAPDNPPSPARLIVCERGGQWSAALRGELAEAGVRLWECRRLQEAWEALAQTPAAFVIAEAAEREPRRPLATDGLVLAGFPQCANRRGRPTRSMARCEWLVARGRGGSFSHVAPAASAPGRPGGPASGQCAAAIAELVERIWASLPWGPPGR